MKWSRCECANASQKFENADKGTRKIERESQSCRCECANDCEHLIAVRVDKVARRSISVLKTLR